MNQRFHKNGHYDQNMPLAQIGTQQFSCPDLSLTVNFKNASMDVLNSPQSQNLKSEFSQLYDLLAVEDGVMFNK